MTVRAIIEIIRMGRFSFLAGGFLLFCTGALVAVLHGAPPDPVAFCGGYAAFGLVHLSVSYSNDYFDRISDRRGVRTMISGGSGVLVARPGLSPVALALALALNGLALAAAAALAVLGIVPPVFVGMVGAGALLGWWYSAPPLRLVARGLGEASTAVALGVLIPATGYLVMAGRLDPALLPLLFPLLCYGMVFILSVEVPDMEADRASGKRTFVVRYGINSSFLLIAACAIAASLFFALFPWHGGDVPVPPVLSLLMLGTATAGVLLPCTTRACLVRRSAANLVALNAFVLFADLSLLVRIAG